MRELNNISRIRVSDIPSDGLKTHFELDAAGVSRRANDPADALEGGNLGLPRCNFIPPLKVELELSLESGTIYLRGSMPFSFTTACSNCLNQATYSDVLDLQIILKKKGSEGLEKDDEDVGFGYYVGEDVECSSIVEDHLMLKLPYSVSCTSDCKGLCPGCGKNLNVELCICKPKVVEEKVNPFAKLKDIKLQ